jgi:hypothetical protein
VTRGRFLTMVLLSVLLLGACTKRPAGAGSTGSPSTPPVTSSPTFLPPLPTEMAKAGPGQPPVIWVGGTLTVVTENRIVVQEAMGTSVPLRRLGKGATAFYRANLVEWGRLPAVARIRTGEQVCVEAALDGRNLLALRVFLGATCGPSR